MVDVGAGVGEEALTFSEALGEVAMSFASKPICRDFTAWKAGGGMLKTGQKTEVVYASCTTFWRGAGASLRSKKEERSPGVPPGEGFCDSRAAGAHVSRVRAIRSGATTWSC